MTKWEYTFTKFYFSHMTIEDVSNLMNLLGEKGWECVSLDMEGNALFKRPLIDANDNK